MMERELLKMKKKRFINEDCSFLTGEAESACTFAQEYVNFTEEDTGSGEVLQVEFLLGSPFHYAPPFFPLGGSLLCLFRIPAVGGDLGGWLGVAGGL